MTKKEALYIKAFIFIVSLSGVSIFLLDTFGKVETEWMTQSHPLLDEAKAIHNLLTPVLLILLGLVIKDHIIKGIKKGLRGKKSGIFLVTLFVVLIFSGQSLLVISNEAFREFFQYFHLGTGIFFTLVFLLHLKLVKK